MVKKLVEEETIVNSLELQCRTEELVHVKGKPSDPGYRNFNIEKQHAFLH